MNIDQIDKEMELMITKKQIEKLKDSKPKKYRYKGPVMSEDFVINSIKNKMIKERYVAVRVRTDKKKKEHGVDLIMHRVHDYKYFFLQAKGTPKKGMTDNRNNYCHMIFGEVMECRVDDEDKYDIEYAVGLPYVYENSIKKLSKASYDAYGVKILLVQSNGDVKEVQRKDLVDKTISNIFK